MHDDTGSLFEKTAEVLIINNEALRRLITIALR